MKRIAIIGTVGVPACYGGFESLVENLLDYTPSEIEYTVFCTSQKYETKFESYKGAKLIIYCNKKTRQNKGGFRGSRRFSDLC